HLTTHRPPHHLRPQLRPNHPDHRHISRRQLLRRRSLRHHEIRGHPRLQSRRTCLHRFQHGQQVDAITVPLDIRVQQGHLTDPGPRPLHRPTPPDPQRNNRITVHTGQHHHPTPTPTQPFFLKATATTES